MTSTATPAKRRRVRLACDVAAACAIGGAVGILTIGALVRTGGGSDVASPRPSSVSGSSISALTSDVELAGPLEVLLVDPPAGILPAEVLAAGPITRSVPVAALPTAVAPTAGPSAPSAPSAPPAAPTPAPAPRPLLSPSSEGGLAIRLGPIDAAVGRGLLATGR